MKCKYKDNYIKVLRSSGYQPWKISVDTEEEIDIFIHTIALCFDINIYLYTQDEENKIIFLNDEWPKDNMELILNNIWS